MLLASVFVAHRDTKGVDVCASLAHIDAHDVGLPREDRRTHAGETKNQAGKKDFQSTLHG